MSKITIRPAQGLWVIRAGGAVLGETRDALELVEDGHSGLLFEPGDSQGLARALTQLAQDGADALVGTGLWQYLHLEAFREDSVVRCSLGSVAA